MFILPINGNGKNKEILNLLKMMMCVLILDELKNSEKSKLAINMFKDFI